jgi:hypothetical protein
VTFIGSSVEAVRTAEGAGIDVRPLKAGQTLIETLIIVHGTIKSRGGERLSAMGGSQKLAGNVIKKIQLNGSPNLTLSVDSVGVLAPDVDNIELDNIRVWALVTWNDQQKLS